ncbi:hypothetical protein TNCT_213511 [Trichonephila clavata]|uniref:Uncharacterized protein n=1 Tax=Trichonephila clavata TaxID=2740835 RepID=A0A8X6JZW7_TRICU|nr:hypothetical protein TNCT_213511 [Trichonephila clavata]
MQHDDVEKENFLGLLKGVPEYAKVDENEVEQRRALKWVNTKKRSHHLLYKPTKISRGGKGCRSREGTASKGVSVTVGKDTRKEVPLHSGAERNPEKGKESQRRLEENYAPDSTTYAAEWRPKSQDFLHLRRCGSCLNVSTIDLAKETPPTTTTTNLELVSCDSTWNP